MAAEGIHAATPLRFSLTLTVLDQLTITIYFIAFQPTSQFVFIGNDPIWLGRAAVDHFPNALPQSKVLKLALRCLKVSELKID